MNKEQLTIVYDCFPRSFILGLIAVPATYMLGSILPITAFLVVWGAMAGISLAAQIINLLDVLRDVRALIVARVPEPKLAMVARIAIRRTLLPIMLTVAMLLWVVHSSIIDELLHIRFTSEWLLYFLVTILGISSWFDVFNRHKMLTSVQISMQKDESDGTLRS